MTIRQYGLQGTSITRDKGGQFITKGRKEGRAKGRQVGKKGKDQIKSSGRNKNPTEDIKILCMHLITQIQYI